MSLWWEKVVCIYLLIIFTCWEKIYTELLMRYTTENVWYTQCVIYLSIAKNYLILLYFLLGPDLVKIHSLQKIYNYLFIDILWRFFSPLCWYHHLYHIYVQRKTLLITHTKFGKGRNNFPLGSLEVPRVVVWFASTSFQPHRFHSFNYWKIYQIYAYGVWLNSLILHNIPMSQLYTYISQQSMIWYKAFLPKCLKRLSLKCF